MHVHRPDYMYQPERSSDNRNGYKVSLQKHVSPSLCELGISLPFPIQRERIPINAITYFHYLDLNFLTESLASKGRHRVFNVHLFASSLHRAVMGYHSGPLSRCFHNTTLVLPAHKPLPRLRPDHVSHALKRRVEDRLVKVPRNFNPLQRIFLSICAVDHVLSACIIFAPIHDMLTALTSRVLVPCSGS